jgi:hypothetical protein
MYDYDCVTPGIGMQLNWVMYENLGGKMSSLSSWMLEIVEIECNSFKNSSLGVLCM